MPRTFIVSRREDIDFSGGLAIGDDGEGGISGDLVRDVKALVSQIMWLLRRSELVRCRAVHAREELVDLLLLVDARKL